jgi:hypothetical protein
MLLIIQENNILHLDSITFGMSGKVSGMYFVKLDFEGQQILKKLIVNRK